MRFAKYLAVTVALLFLSACESRHLVVDGTCLTCFNNPVSGEAVNYDESKYSNESRSSIGSTASSKSKPGDSIDFRYLTSKNFYYHWAARTPNPEEHIEFLASTYFSKYRAADEFSKRREMDEIRPTILANIDKAKSNGVLINQRGIYLTKYDFDKGVFNVSFVRKRSLGMDVFGKPDDNKLLDFQMPNRARYDVAVSPQAAERAIKDNRRGARSALTDTYFRIDKVSPACTLRSCTIYASPVSFALMNIKTKEVIGQYTF